MGYKIGSFNVRQLSFSTKDEEHGDARSVKRAYSDIGLIIRDNFDIVAMQEVKTDRILPLLFPETTGWEHRWALSRSKTRDSNEGYAFAWNARRFCSVAEPHLWEQYVRDPVLGQRGLIRHPFYGRFAPIRGPFCEFRLINTHIRFMPKEEPEQERGQIELRKREFRVLTEQILNRIEDKRYGNNRVGYTLLMGDYNLNLRNGLNSSPYVEEFIYVQDGLRQKEYVTVQKMPTTLSRSSYEDVTTGEKHYIYNGYANNYDHFTYNTGQSIRVVDPHALDAVELYRKRDFERYWYEISDHIPVMVDIEFI